jgi:ABC-type oligopeptide transport system substrate-binding subunit
MIQKKSWLMWFIGLMLCSAFLVGCAATGSTVSGTQKFAKAKYDERFDPAGWLNPNSPSFWLDYQNVYNGGGSAGCR